MYYYTALLRIKQELGNIMGETGAPEAAKDSNSALEDFAFEVGYNLSPNTEC